MSHLTHSFTMDATPPEAHDAIIDVRSWWGATNIVGERVVWECSDECFHVCHDAWRHHITESLRQRIVPGHGTMRTREEDQAAVRQHAEARS